MTVPKPKNANIRLLACLVDEDDTDDSDYRFLLDRQHVKYVTTAPRTFRGAEDDRTFEPILLGELLLPSLIGDWNKGHVANDPQTGEVAFVTVCLAQAENLWHPVKLNELDFTRQDRVRQRVHISTHPELNDGKPVLVKLAVWPWEITPMEVETTAHQRTTAMTKVSAPNFSAISPRAKTGGAWLAWSLSGCKALGPRGRETSRAARRVWGDYMSLESSLGISRNTTFSYGMGHDVVLVDFETAKHNCSPQELEDEMSALKSSLEDTSFRGRSRTSS